MVCDLGRFDTRCNRLLYFLALKVSSGSGVVRNPTTIGMAPRPPHPNLIISEGS